MNLRARLFENTAIYKARIQQNHRINIPDIEASTLGVSSNDTVRVVLHKIEDTKSLSRNRISFLATVQKSGRVTVPDEVRQVNDIKPGNSYQVIIRDTDI